MTVIDGIGTFYVVESMFRVRKLSSRLWKFPLPHKEVVKASRAQLDVSGGQFRADMILAVRNR